MEAAVLEPDTADCIRAVLVRGFVQSYFGSKNELRYYLVFLHTGHLRLREGTDQPKVTRL